MNDQYTQKWEYHSKCYPDVNSIRDWWSWSAGIVRCWSKPDVTLIHSYTWGWDGNVSLFYRLWCATIFTSNNLHHLWHAWHYFSTTKTPSILFSLCCVIIFDSKMTMHLNLLAGSDCQNVLHREGLCSSIEWKQRSEFHLLFSGLAHARALLLLLS